MKESAENKTAVGPSMVALLRGMPEAPWRIFFPLGIAGLFLGLSCWWTVFPAPAILWHPELMISAFLVPIATGFLTYTLPRFFTSRRTTQWEFWLFASLEVALLVAVLLTQQWWVTCLRLAVMVLFFWFAFSRFPINRPAPVFAVYICAGILLGLIGALADFAVQQQWFTVSLDIRKYLARLHRTTYYQGFFWLLLAGMGTRLFPMLTISTRRRGEPMWQASLGFSRWIWYPILVGLAGSFVWELRPWNLWVRAIAFAYIAWQGWLLLRPPARRGPVMRYVKIAAAAMVLGHTLVAIFPDYEPQLRHLAFGAGFGIATLLVVTRVSLAHEGAELVRESKSVAFEIAFALLLSGVVLRAAAVFPDVFMVQIKLAALLFLAGTCIWTIALCVSLVKDRKQAPRVSA